MQVLQSGDAELGVGGAGRDDDGPRGEHVAVGQAQPVVPVMGRQARRLPQEQERGAEGPGLLEGLRGQCGPADALGEAGVVPDHRAGCRLAADGSRLHRHGPQAFRRLHLQEADVVRTNLPCELHPVIDRHWLPSICQTNAPREEGLILSLPAKEKNSRVLKKKVTLLREEDREATEVNDLIVYLRLTEVGIDGEFSGQ